MNNIDVNILERDTYCIWRTTNLGAACGRRESIPDSSAKDPSRWIHKGYMR